ncbi:MAG: DUF1045 domain-containing protein [Marinosulfonomonas sp.]
MRYAIYFLPERNSELAEFGAKWLGWNIATGEAPAHPVVPGLPQEVSSLTATPRKYGFHATLKAPFRLAQSKTQKQLSIELHDLAQDFAPFTIGQLKVTNLGGFLALTESTPTKELDEFAQDCVKRFDRFRAPLTEAERMRRRKANLSERQDTLLRAWGYPFVLDEYRFHLTLTSKLEPELAKQVQAALEEYLQDLLQPPVVMQSVCLCAELETGAFRLIERVPLSGQ